MRRTAESTLARHCISATAASGFVAVIHAWNASTNASHILATVNLAVTIYSTCTSAEPQAIYRQLNQKSMSTIFTTNDLPYCLTYQQLAMNSEQTVNIEKNTAHKLMVNTINLLM